MFNKNLKYIIPIIILIIIIIFLQVNETFTDKIEAPEALRSLFIDKIDKYLRDELLFKENIDIYKLKSSSKIIAENIIRMREIEDFLFLRYISFNQKLKYIVSPLEHLNNIYSGYLITNNFSTDDKHKSYGFMLEFNPNNNDNSNIKDNFAEFTIDFFNNQRDNIDRFIDIKKAQEDENYINLERKSVNIYTSYNTPNDFFQYFNKGDNEDIKSIAVFRKQYNLDFINSFPDGKFNVLDHKMNYILKDCKIHIPYCNINLPRYDNIYGRDKLITGRYNHHIKNYVTIDSDEKIAGKSGKSSPSDGMDDMEILKLIQKILSEEPKRTWNELSKKERYILKEKDIIQFEEDKINELLLMDNHDNITDDERDLMEREGLEIKSSSNDFQYDNNSDFNTDMGKIFITPAPVPAPAPAPATTATDAFIGSYINERFTNMNENFTNEIKNPYQTYRDERTCYNKKNTDKKLDKLKNRHYSILDSKSKNLKGKEKILKLLNELSGLKVRKNYKEEKYWYGGIDIDNIMKCYSSKGQCLLFDSEKECLNSLNEEISKLENKDQKNIIDHLFYENKLHEMDPLSLLEPGFIDKELHEDYNLLNDFNCFPLKKDKVTCKHKVESNISDVITFNNDNKDYTDILEKNKILGLHINYESKGDTDEEKEENDRKERQMTYLLEPSLPQYKNLDYNTLFQKFKYKFRISNKYDSTTNEFSTMEILENNISNGYIRNNSGNILKLLLKDRIYLFINKKVELNLRVYRKVDGKEQEIARKVLPTKLKGKFTEDINLFLRTNNKTIFDSIKRVDQLQNLTFPYDPFLDVIVKE